MFDDKGEHIVVVNDSMGLCEGGKKVIFKARLLSKGSAQTWTLVVIELPEL